MRRKNPHTEAFCEPRTLSSSKVTIGDLERMETAILSALTSEDALTKIGEQSYIHKNGFVKLTLAKVNGKKYRVHIFDVDAVADQNIHNHRWDFTSKVLCGALPMYLYKVIDGKEYYFHTYTRNGNTYTVVHQGFCDIVEAPLRYFDAGTGYMMPKELHHRIGAVEELTVTYMVTEETDQPTCDLINLEDKSEGGEEVIEPPLDSKTVFQSLQLVLGKIRILKEQITMGME